MESINDVVDFRFALTIQNRNNVKPDIQLDLMLIIIGRGSGIDMGAFLSVDSHLGSAIFVILACLHLNENNVVPIKSDNVDFFSISTPIPLKNLIALVGKVLDSNLFPKLSK